MNRTQLIQWFIRRRGYKKYLEIGIDKAANNFSHIACEFKTGVDPRVGRTMPPSFYRMTSDAFFKQNKEKYDIVFIDGLHLENQVVRDVENSLLFLNEGGTIILHDCHPYNQYVGGDEPFPGKSWYGTVWRAWAYFRHTRNDLLMNTYNSDCGLGIIQRGKQEPFFMLVTKWEDYSKYQNQMLSLISGEQLEAIYDK